MNIYVNSIAAISPINSFDASNLILDLPTPEASGFACVEPVYKEIIISKNLRRMGKAVRMGMACAIKVLADTQIEQPDAIITGTGLGCLLDTEKFLGQMVEYNESTMNPTAFIQSTHNTVAGQIALHLGCKSYNFTFTQKSASFESALLESMMLINDGEANNVLVGGIDEITDNTFALIEKAGCAANESGKGKYIPGEGAAFFMLEGQKSEKCIAQIKGVSVKYGLNSDKEIGEELNHFLAQYSLNSQQIDLVLSGNNGDVFNTKHYAFLDAAFTSSQLINFKDYCGEHDSASSFALWLAVKSIALNKVKNVLIYNSERGYNHSFILVTAC